MSIHIQNRLEIRPGPGGGIIQIPGCEPTSIHSTDSLVENMKFYCNASFITVETALEVVPGSRVEFLHNSGGGRGVRMRFFVLPDGPPQPPVCPQGCVTDWYAILRQNADATVDEEQDDTQTIDQICDTFSFRSDNSELL